MKYVTLFVFLYPLFMAIFWMIGSIAFFLRRETYERRPQLPAYPRVAILVPCHNEELTIRDAIKQLSKNRYPDFEIIAINDGSTDRTGEILSKLAHRIKPLRVVTLTSNYGKAMALRAGALASSAEFLMCIDADALLAKDALYWMVHHFMNGARVGAVTGNPRVLNRTSLLARIQIGEFSAIVGMVKRAQRNIGRVFTVSGVNTCYRRAALHDVGYWSPDTVTEDIDISWRLQIKHWDIRYEPRAVTWILVPETLRSLWRQRLRWAQGGFEAAIKYFHPMRSWTRRRMWPVYVEYWTGVLWSYAFMFTVVCWLGTLVVPDWPIELAVLTLIPGWTGVILGIACLAQFTIGLALDDPYERRGQFRYIFWAIWYPVVYWLINAMTTVIAVPKGSFQYGKTPYAVWKSPTRRMKELFVGMQPRRHVEQRHYFTKSKFVTYSRRATVLVLTIIFWGLWSYLVTPLVSLALWFAGIYLFVDRMISMGGYQMFAGQLVLYGSLTLLMSFVLTLWIVWNQMRYGRNERRTVPPAHVSETQVATAMNLSPVLVGVLRSAKEIVLHYDGHDQPKIARYGDLESPLIRASPNIAQFPSPKRSNIETFKR